MVAGAWAGTPSTWPRRFCWNLGDGTRAFARRLAERHRGAVLHYLKAVREAGTEAAGPVMAKMREPPVENSVPRGGMPREGGRLLRDARMFQAKQSGESRGEWGLLRRVATLGGTDAFRPLGEGEWPLVRR